MPAFSFSAPSPTPVDDAYYRKFAPRPHATYLEEPQACNGLLSYDGTGHVMPYSMLQRVAHGKGLPEVYYKTKRVPMNYCKPVDHVWTFPKSRAHFFDAVPATYRSEHLSSEQISLIERFRHSLPVSQRYALKWAYVYGSVGVFRLDSIGGLAAGEGIPYRVLSENEDVYLNAATGEEILLPGH